MKKVRLGDICTVVSGTTPKSHVDEYWNGDKVWITPAEINEDTLVVTDSVRHISESAVKDSSLKSFPKGTVILSSRAPIGKTAIAGCEMYCNQGFKNLICSEKINNLYLLYFLRSRKDYLNSLGRGATFKEISKGIVENIKVPLPSIDTQIQIGNRIRTIEKLIGLRKKQLFLLDDLIKSRFVEMFGGDEKKEYCALNDCCESITGGSTPSMKQEDFYGGNIPFIKSGDVKTDYVSSGALWLTKKALEESTAKLVPKNTVIVVTRSGILKHKLPVAITSVPVVINQDIKAFRPKSDFLPEYLAWAIRSKENFLLSKTRAMTVDNIESKELYGIKIKHISITKQLDFVSFIQKIDKSKLAVKKSLEELETLKNSLMQQYFD